MKKFVCFVLLTLSTVPSWAALVTYNFAFTGSTSGAATSVTGTLDPNFTVGSMSIGNTNGIVPAINSSSPSSGYTGASGTNNIGNAYRIGALNTAASGSGYISLSVTNNTGLAQLLTDFDFGTRSTGTGPQAFNLLAGPGFTTLVTSGSITNDGVWRYLNNTVTSFSIPSGTTEFRLYGHSGAGTAALNTTNGRYDDFAITFDITAIPEPSAYLFGALATMLAGGATFGRRLFARG